MKNYRRFISLIVLMTGCNALWGQLSVTGLKTEYKNDPVGIEQPRPRLSWVLESEEMNSMQESYEIRTALTEKDLERGRRLLGETGRVNTSNSIQIPYQGPSLSSFQRVYWQVRVWDNHGNRSKWSEPAFWETAFMGDARWTARWISPAWEEDPKVSQPSPYLRNEFRLTGEVESARLYISSHGLYRAEINGKRVGDQEFTPGWTSYDTRLQYQTYDVTDLIKTGENAMGVILGDGWFRGNLGWVDNRNIWGEELAAIAELHLTYTDGSGDVITTGEGWKAATGPILESDIYNGEVYDARREMPGWSSPGFDDSGWTEVKVAEHTTETLIAPEGPPVRIVDELEPLWVKKNDEGWMIDMGQNMVGWVRIRVSGNEGDRIVLRHAEVLDKEGNMYYDNLRSAEATNTCFLRGGGEEVFEPHFTFQGFRYVMVEGYPGELTPDKVRGMVIHSDMKPAGSFTCSDSLINQLQHNIVWGLKGNFLDVPTDCPQRDERLGWTGDAQVFAPTACFNVDAATFYTKWLKDLAADQKEDGGIPHVVPDILGGAGATGWADAGVVIPWVVYLNYGDTRILEQQYESMQRWIGFMQEHAGDDYIWQERDHHFGDWLAFHSDRSDYMGAYTTKDLIATAYYAYSSSIVSRVASLLGKPGDAERYRELSERVKEAFNREYVTPNGRLVSHTQTAYTLALAFDLLDGETAGKAASHLAGDVEQFGHITTGFLGTPLISLTLTEQGRNDLAYLLLNRKEYPSWLYPVTMGATTIWERWDGQKPDSTFQNPGMNSFNHYAYGAIGKWLYEVAAGIGIDPEQPGYRHILIHPRPGGGLTYARATHESMYGTIVSGWELEGEKLQMEVEVPANTTATISIPGTPEDIIIKGTGIGQSEIDYTVEDGLVKAVTGSGKYEISTRFTQEGPK